MATGCDDCSHGPSSTGNIASTVFSVWNQYIAITPLENGPLVVDWAIPLFNMQGVYFISELGKQEALKVGVQHAEHLYVGADTVSWRTALPEEKAKLRTRAWNSSGCLCGPDCCR